MIAAYRSARISMESECHPRRALLLSALVACAPPPSSGAAHSTPPPASFASSAPSVPKPRPPTLFAIDVFGTRAMPAEEVIALSGLPRPPAVVEDTFARMREAEERLRATGRFAFARASFVEYFSDDKAGRVYVTIDVVDRGDEWRMNFAPRPGGRFDDPAGLLAQWHAYETRFVELVRAGDARLAVEGSCRALHCLSFDHPDLAPYDERFAREVPLHFDELARIVREDADDAHRASAAFLLAYGKDTQAVVGALLPVVRDPSASVRNDAMRVFCGLTRKAPDARVPLEPFLDALHFPETTDRNKAAAALLPLVQRAPEASREPVLRRAGDVLLAMVRLWQPNNHDWAKRILVVLAGKDLGDDPRAWEAWMREATATK